jgi:hypothetical protein
MTWIQHYAADWRTELKIIRQRMIVSLGLSKKQPS